MNTKLSTEELFSLLSNRFYEERQTRSSANYTGHAYKAVIDTLRDFVEEFSEGRFQVIVKPEPIKYP